MPGGKRRPSGSNRPDRKRNSPTPRAPGALGLRKLPSGDHALVHPPCIEERLEDYREGLEVWEAGEPEEAREILRYALEGCGDNLWIHVALGRIALESDRNPLLARGHFGYAFELARQTIPPGFGGRLPRNEPDNQPLYDAIAGLTEALEHLGQEGEARELRRLASVWSGAEPVARKREDRESS